MNNIYEKLIPNNNPTNYSLIIFILLSIINIVSLYFFSFYNLKYLLQLDANHFLLLILFLVIFNFTLVILSIIYSLERFLYVLIINNLVILYILYPIIKDNYLIYLLLLAGFNIVGINIYYLLEKIYKNNININWLNIFKTSWIYLIWTYLFFIFVLLTLLPSLEKLKFQDIYNSLNKLNYLSLNYFYSLDEKVINILNKNIDQKLPQNIKQDLVIKALKDLNNKFNLTLTTDSTLKEAVAQYLANQIDLMNQNQDKIYLIKSMIILLLIIIIQPFLYILGYLIAFFSWLLVKILISLKIFKITYNQILKEEITL
jgi:hypothetical protein